MVTPDVPYRGQILQTPKSTCGYLARLLSLAEQSLSGPSSLFLGEVGSLYAMRAFYLRLLTPDGALPSVSGPARKKVGLTT